MEKEDKKMYLVIFKQNEQQTAYLGTALNYKQAFAIAQNFLNQNENVKSEQVFVEEYEFKKVLKILDAKDVN